MSVATIVSQLNLYTIGDPIARLAVYKKAVTAGKVMLERKKARRKLLKYTNTRHPNKGQRTECFEASKKAIKELRVQRSYRATRNFREHSKFNLDLVIDNQPMEEAFSLPSPADEPFSPIAEALIRKDARFAYFLADQVPVEDFPTCEIDETDVVVLDGMTIWPSAKTYVCCADKFVN